MKRAKPPSAGLAQCLLEFGKGRLYYRLYAQSVDVQGRYSYFDTLLPL